MDRIVDMFDQHSETTKIVLKYLQLVFAIASLVGALFMVISILWLNRTAKAHGRFLLYLGLNEIFLAMVYICAAEFRMPPSDTIYCKMQGFIVHFLNVASWVWTSCIAFNMWAHVVHGTTNEEMLRREKYCHAITWIFATVLAGGFCVHLGSGTDDVMLSWCWVGPKDLNVFFYFYLPLLIVITLNSTFVGHVVYTIIKAFNKNAEVQTGLLSTRSAAQVRKFAVRIIFYPIVLIVCFSGAFVDRVYMYFTQTSTTVLATLHVVMVLHGFMTAIVYTFSSSLSEGYRKRWKLWKRTADGLEFSSSTGDINGALDG